MASRGFLIGTATVLAAALAATFLLAGAGPAGAAFPGENGRIAYHNYGSIWTMDPDGSGRTELTPHDPDLPDWQFNRDPAVSPDGTEIAFVGYSDSRGDEIYVMGADGSSIRRPTSDPAPDAQPSWSPDGEELLFVSGRDHDSDPKARDIYATGADGSGLRRLTRDAAPESHPAWSPDGNEVAFLSGGDVWVMGADGSDRTNLTAPDSYHAYNLPVDWSPDGEKLLFSGHTQDGPSPSGWYTMNADGSGKAALPIAEKPQGWSGYTTADYSPDGEKLVVTRTTECPSDFCSSENDYYDVAYTVNVDGTGLKQITDLTDLDQYDISLDWGPLPSGQQGDTTDPTITRTRPAPGSEVRDRTPTVRAVVRDGGSELDKADIRLRVDGKRKGFSYDQRTDRLSRTTNKLSYGRHTVMVTAEDETGNREVRAWSFRVVKRR